MLDPEVNIVCCMSSKAGLLGRSSCRASLSRGFNRKKLPDHYEQLAEEIWGKRRQTNNRLYNGTKFRMDSVSFSAEHERRILTFNLGITCYKDFIGTNWSPSACELQELGRKDFGNPQAYLSEALGVGSFVQTADHHVVLLHRSQHCGEAAGLWDVPGGHAEPQELVGTLKADDIDVESLCPKAVIDEIFNSILREIRDEVNIPEISLSDPQLIGIVRNTASAGRPSVEFLIKCDLNSFDILKLYCIGDQSEAEESVSIKVIPADSVQRLQQDDPQMWNSLAPSAKGCFQLYSLFKTS